MGENNNYEVSVVIVTYNPIWEKLRDTLHSILIQKNVRYQIVISDDGSTENCFEKVRDFFQNNHFDEYLLIDNKINKGTVKNVLSGIQSSNGKYVKTISPGDELHGSDILRQWIDFLEVKNTKWSFSDALYYHKENGKICFDREKAHPNNIRPYLKGNIEACRWNYAVLDDIALGAAMLCERELQQEYLEAIAGNVVYAEDHIWRKMMFDGVIGSYFPENAVLYEYGSGISTVDNQKWKERLDKDWENADCIIFNPKYELDKFQKKMLKNQKWKKSYKKFFIKGKVMNWYSRKFSCRMTKTDEIVGEQQNASN